MNAWNRTTDSGILMSQGPDVWNSGRVMAVLPLPGRRLLAGSSDAGVWLVTADGASATSVGDWDNAAVRCLAQLADGRFVAGVVGGIQISLAPDPAGAWAYVSVPSAGGGSVTVSEIAQLTRDGEGVMVIATDEGVLWSPIPAAPGDFTWIATNVMTDVCSLVSSSRERLFAGVQHPFGPGYEILKGRFDGDQLVFSGTDYDQTIDRKLFGTVALAACRDHPEHAYALVGSHKTDTIAALLRWRDDAGLGVWMALPVPQDQQLLQAGQFARNQAIAVGNRNPERVAFSSGTFEVPWVSSDGGQNWASSYFSGVRLHADMDALAFDSEDQTDSRLIVSGDGGVFVSDDGGVTYSTQYNRRLPLLQFYVGFGRGFVAASSSHPDVVGGALQDNGVVLQAGSDAPWQSVVGGDGGDVALLPGNRFIHHLNTFTTPRIVEFAPSGGGGPAVLSEYETPENPRRADVVGPDGTITVVHPEFRPIVCPIPDFAPAGGIRPLAFAAHGNELYLLLDDLQALWWDPLKTLDPSVEITGLACDRNGARLTVGTSTGRIISYSVRREQPRIVDTVEGTMAGIVYPSTLRITDLSTNPLSVEAPGYAVSRPGVWADGSIIRSIDAAHWEVVATAMPDGRAVKGMSVDHDNQVVYAMTLTGIWKGSDGGETWAALTRDGLPRALNQSEIRFVDHPTDGPVLYLSTWGNSVWRLQV